MNLYKSFKPLSYERLKHLQRPHLVKHIKQCYEALYELLLIVNDDASDYENLYPSMCEQIKVIHDREPITGGFRDVCNRGHQK